MVIPFRFASAEISDFPADVAAPAREFVERVTAIPRDSPVREHRVGSGWQSTGQVERDLRGVDGMVIVGNVGSGKTHLLAGIGNALENLAPYVFRSALAIVDEAKARINNDQAGCDYAAFTGILLLDDLSGVRITDFAADVLARVVRRRYDDALLTVVTTHTEHSTLAEMYGAAIASRLLEFGPILKLAGSDRRMVAVSS